MTSLEDYFLRYDNEINILLECIALDQCSQFNEFRLPDRENCITCNHELWATRSEDKMNILSRCSRNSNFSGFICTNSPKGDRGSVLMYVDILTYSYITLLIRDLYFRVWYSNLSDLSFKSMKYRTIFICLV